jgi:flagellar basal-body rod protein FlgB
MLDSIFQSGSLPVLERLVEFTNQRQMVLADDAANLSTPNFLPRDLDTRSFQATLRDALDHRPNQNAPLELHDTDQVEFGSEGMTTHAQPANEGILAHDGNNGNLERLMQHMAENNLAHSTGIQLIRSELSLLKMAIQGG